ncbi:hypothetical protein [Variovorax sp. JS1663]|uniref:hypothetical protein n=1 Tax=Variovorax sp. JS1663 TaxID=1851577 RepID=UPI000B348208|nr:hypothetical protein [Variovorax sp. JS1663]OUM02000.1 hypothetical protein A8M77_12875 [Variovorax sp. JS1663]
MTTKNAMLDESAKLQAAAQMLSASADEMAAARRAAMDASPPTITSGEFSLSILRENLMRDAVTSILLKAISKSIEGVKGAQSELEAAIEEANAKIAKVQQIRKALGVFASLIGLAEAIVVAQPAGILSALKGVKEATQSA